MMNEVVMLFTLQGQIIGELVQELTIRGGVTLKNPALVMNQGTSVSGLSPRVRGNPDIIVQKPAPIGSIPACAGQPSSMCGISSWIMVYPRVCGATRFHRENGPLQWGLSPRVRGNR